MSDCECEIKDVEQVIIKEPTVVNVEKPTRKPRAPTAYNLFVKENMSKFGDIPVKERMSKIAQLWKAEKAKAEKKAKKKPKKAKK